MSVLQEELQHLSEDFPATDHEAAQSYRDARLEFEDVGSARVALNALGLVGHEVAAELHEPTKRLYELNDGIERIRWQLERGIPMTPAYFPKKSVDVLLTAIEVASQEHTSGPGSYYANLGGYLLRDLRTQSHGAGVTLEPSGRPFVKI